MPQAVTIRSLPAAFEMMKTMRVEGPDWGADYRPLARQALIGILEDQMAAAIDRHLDAMGRRDAADRRNGSYERHPLTELGPGTTPLFLDFFRFFSHLCENLTPTPRGGTMNGVTRYVLRQLAWGMILVSAGLTCILWLTQSLRLVDMIVNRGLSAGRFFYLTMLLLPNFITIILPIALFTVVVFTYNKLITDREIVVMQASGLGPVAIAKPAFILSLVVVMLGYALNFHILPASYQRFRELQWDIRYNYTHVLLQEGAFNSVATGITVYVRARSTDGQLLGILVHDARNQEKPFTMMAERGALMDTERGARVVMFDGNRQQVDKNSNQLSILYFDRYVFELTPSEPPEGVRFREPRERTVGELFNIDEDPSLDPRDRGKFKVEGHRRLLSPLWSLAFALVGLVALLSGGFSRRTQSGRIVIAVAIMVALQGFSLGAENFAARHLDVVPLLYALVLSTIAIAFTCLVRPVRLARLHLVAKPS